MLRQVDTELLEIMHKLHISPDKVKKHLIKIINKKDYCF